MTDLDYLLTGDPGEKITWAGHIAWGYPVKGSRRSIAHLEATDQAARLKFGGGLVILQSAYHTGYAPSAGTHDLDAVYDMQIPGVEWWEQQRFLRAQGWAAWYRFPPAFSEHVHAVSLGYTTPVGIYVPAQVDDYYRRALGLKGQHDSGIDDTWHPPNIDATIFDYSAWKAGQDMFSEEDRATIEATKDAVADLAAAEARRAKATKDRDRRLAKGIRTAARDAASDTRARLVAIADELDSE